MADSMDDLFESPAPSFEPSGAEQILKTHYGIDGAAKLLVSERDQNFKIDTEDGQRFLLKIANAAESPDVIDYENAIVRHIEEVAPEFPVPRLISSTDGSASVLVDAPNGKSHLVRLLSWLDGVLLRDVEIKMPLQRQLGVALAQLGRALRGLFHPAAAKPLLWDITQIVSLSDKVQFVEDPGLQEMCADFITYFRDNVQVKLKTLRAQVIYNDLNPSNVLVSKEEIPRLTGVIDFGDTVHGPLICDVAVAASYQLTDSDDPFSGVLEFVSAYHGITPLETREIELLLDLIVARAVTTIVVTSWRANLHPANRDYILRNATSAERNLRTLMSMDKKNTIDRILNACPTGGSKLETPQAETNSRILLNRRDELLGSAYRLFYENPLNIVRGEGVWLYDSSGRAFLDAYNNVPLVGHCHPRVVAALSSQASTLNSHTRYLHDRILDYAERLLGMFPASLNRVMFGCTGSEANELALRIARAYTGNRGVIATQFAYHGNTIAIAQLSPSYVSGEEREDWVELVSPPDSYRAGGGSVGTESANRQFLSNIDVAIENLASRGIAPAALLLDAGFTSDGMYRPAARLLAEAARRVRAAGGVYIADEVQAGFGRFGDALWGFGDGEFVPEIVTLGKPIGNGHPLAATIVQDHVLDAFSAQTRYFNTFGGNPVSAAVGLAVLEVFEQNDLLANSANTGQYLHGQLQQLASVHSRIGDIRGSGLFAGVELVVNGDSGAFATDATKLVVNSMRENGVLISMIGPNANVLKIRPPLPFQLRHVDQLIETLDRCLSIAEKTA